MEKFDQNKNQKEEDLNSSVCLRLRHTQVGSKYILVRFTVRYVIY